MDNVDNKEAIRKLIQFRRILEKGVFPVGYRFDAEPFDMAIAAMEQQEKDRWIPVSVALPKEKAEYLVTYHPCYWDDVETDIKIGIDSFRGKTTWAKRKYQRVIAFRPLPEPYQEDEA